VGEKNRPRPILLGPGQGTVCVARGNRMTFKALGSMGGGHFSLMERTLPPGGRMPPAHRHLACDEAYYVLEGEVTFLVDGETRIGSRGWWVLVPGGLGHTFGNTSGEPALLLVLHAPPLDRYFAELHELWNREGPPDRSAETELMRRHGMEPA